MLIFSYISKRLFKIGIYLYMAVWGVPCSAFSLCISALPIMPLIYCLQYNI